MTNERPGGAAPPIAHLGLIGAWAAIAVATGYAIVAGGGSGQAGTQLTGYRILSVVLITSALAIWMVASVRRPFWRARSALSWGFAAVLTALVLGLAGSAQPRLGTDYLAYAVLLTGGYLLLQRLFAHPFFAPRLGGLAVILSVVTSLSYMTAVFIDWVFFWTQAARLAVPPLRPYGEGIWWGNPIPVAAASGLLAVAAVAHLGLSTTRARLMSGIVVTLALVATFLTGARGPWLALVVSGAVGIVAMMLRAENRAAARLVLASVRVRVVVGATAVVATLLGIVLWPAIGLRLEQPASDRIAFASASARMFGEHLLTGIGPGMWVVSRIKYTRPPEIDEYVPHAHNLVLQTLAELGLVGAIAGIVVVFVVLRLVVRGLRSSDSLTRRLGWATLLGGVFVLVQQFTAMYADTAGIWFCFALAAARLDARTTRETRPAATRAFGPVALAMVLVFGVAAAWLAYSERASVANDAAVAAANAEDWPAALASAQLASQDDPAMPPYDFTLGLAQAYTGDRTGALAHLRASAAVDDYPVAWLDVARLDLDLGNWEDARTDVAKAMRLGYQQPQVAVGATQLFLELGDRMAAVNALADALLVAPTLASDPFFAEADRQQILADAVSVALERAGPDLGYRLALEAGRSQIASAIVAEMPVDQRAVPDLVVRSWSGDLAAFANLHARAMADPLDVDTVLQCERVTNERRSRGFVDADWTCSGTVVPGIPVLVRVVQRRETLSPLPGGADPTAHFVDVYRRQGPFNQLVPGIWQLTVLPL